MLWIICCFMWKRTRLLLLILPLISSFFFCSNFQISNNFISLFSRTERPTKLKLGPHMDSRLVYRVYLNQAAGAYLFFYFFNFFSLKFQNINFLSHFSVRPTKLKLDTHMRNGLIYCVHQIQAARIYLFLYFSSFFCLSNWQRLKTCIDLQNCFNIPLMAMAGGMWALLTTVCYIVFGMEPVCIGVGIGVCTLSSERMGGFWSDSWIHHWDAIFKVTDAFRMSYLDQKQFVYTLFLDSVDGFRPNLVCCNIEIGKIDSS